MPNILYLFGVITSHCFTNRSTFNSYPRPRTFELHKKVFFVVVFLCLLVLRKRVHEWDGGKVEGEGKRES